MELHEQCPNISDIGLRTIAVTVWAHCQRQIAFFYICPMTYCPICIRVLPFPGQSGTNMRKRAVIVAADIASVTVIGEREREAVPERGERDIVGGPGAGSGGTSQVSEGGEMGEGGHGGGEGGDWAC